VGICTGDEARSRSHARDFAGDRSQKIGGSAALEVVKDIAAKFMAELIKPFIGG
jgi:hypothetical protein